MDEQMFCYQCEQAAHGIGCTGKAGVCGKSAETADAQDRLTGALIGFATLLLDIGKPIQPPQAAVTAVAGHSIARPIAFGNRVPPQRTVRGETPRRPA